MGKKSESTNLNTDHHSAGKHAERNSYKTKLFRAFRTRPEILHHFSSTVTANAIPVLAETVNVIIRA